MPTIRDIYQKLREFSQQPPKDLEALDVIVMEVNHQSMCEDTCHAWDAIQTNQEEVDTENLSIFIGWSALMIAEDAGLGRNGSVYYADWLTQAITGISIDLLCRGASQGSRRAQQLQKANAIAAESANEPLFIPQRFSTNAEKWWRTYKLVTEDILDACMEAEVEDWKEEYRGWADDE